VAEGQIPIRHQLAISTLNQRLHDDSLPERNRDASDLRAYRGIAPVRQDLVAGQIDLTLEPPVDLPLVRAGDIKAYAVTSDTRLELAPDIPTFRELGLPALSWSVWFGLFAPRARQAMSLAGSMRRRLKHWLIRWCAPDSGLGSKFSRASGRRRRHSARVVKADAERFWPSSRKPASSRSEPKPVIWAKRG